MCVEGRSDSTHYAPDEWDDPVVIRTYAKLLAQKLGMLRNGFPDSVCNSSLPDSSVWPEAFALYYSSRVRNTASYSDYGVDQSGARSLRFIDLENGSTVPSCSGGSVNNAGFGNEVAVAGTLWDLADAQNDNPNGDAYGDSLQICQCSILYITYSKGPIQTARAFMDSIVAYYEPEVNTKYHWDYLRVFYEHGVYAPTGVPELRIVPPALTLLPARPNPFNPATSIGFGIPGDAKRRVSLRIFNVHGALVRELVRGEFEPGFHEVTWRGDTEHGVAAGSGVYFCKLESGSSSRTTKLVLTR